MTINYAICSYFIPKSGSSIEYPVLMNWSDNRSAISWTKRAARSTIAGKALARMFCCLAFNNPIACSADYISTSDNHCADLISRLKTDEQTSFNIFCLVPEKSNDEILSSLEPQSRLSLLPYAGVVVRNLSGAGCSSSASTEGSRKRPFLE